MGGPAQIKINLKRVLCNDDLLQSTVDYSFTKTPFGVEMLVVSTPEGVLFLGFGVEALVEAQAEFSNVSFKERICLHSQKLEHYFEGESTEVDVLVCVSDFRFKVLKTLIDLAPSGELISYSDLALAVGCAGGVRTVASAVAQNPVSLLIPCHRVVRRSGEIGKYRWGSHVKQSIIEYECKSLRYEF